MCVVPELKYDAYLLTRLPEGDSQVHRLCNPPDARYEKHARLLEKWFNDLAPSNQHLYDRLTNPDPKEFESGRWELTAGRFFAGREYKVEFDPKVPSTTPGKPPKTPDLRVDNGELRYLVEVFHLNPSNDVIEQERRYSQLSNELTSRLNFDDALVSVTIARSDALDTYPKVETVDSMVELLQEWLDHGHEGRFEHHRGKLPFWAYWMPHSEKYVSVTPLGGAIGGGQRIQARIDDKLGSYRDVDDTLVLFIAADHWTITMHGMITAMFGNEQISFDANDPTNEERVSVRYGGGIPIDDEDYVGGSLVEGGVMGQPATKIIAGCIFARHTLFNEDTGSWNVEITYVHNPYSDRRLPDDTFAPFAEHQVDGPVMRWVRDGDGLAVILD